MAKYLAIISCSNGYRCGCCRQEWKETREFESDNNESAKDYATIEWADDECGMLEEIYKIEEKIYG